MDTQKSPPGAYSQGASLSEAPAKLSLIEGDYLASYLKRIRPSSLEIHILDGQVTLRLFWKALTGCYHAEIVYDLAAMQEDDQLDIIEECSPLLLDILESIADRSWLLAQALHDRMVLEIAEGACYHKTSLSLLT